MENNTDFTQLLCRQSRLPADGAVLPLVHNLHVRHGHLLRRPHPGASLLSIGCRAVAALLHICLAISPAAAAAEPAGPSCGLLGCLLDAGLRQPHQDSRASPAGRFLRAPAPAHRHRVLVTSPALNSSVLVCLCVWARGVWAYGCACAHVGMWLRADCARTRRATTKAASPSASSTSLRSSSSVLCMCACARACLCACFCVTEDALLHAPPSFFRVEGIARD